MKGCPERLAWWFTIVLVVFVLWWLDVVVVAAVVVNLLRCFFFSSRFGCLAGGLLQRGAQNVSAESQTQTHKLSSCPRAASASAWRNVSRAANGTGPGSKNDGDASFSRRRAPPCVRQLQLNGCWGGGLGLGLGVGCAAGDGKTVLPSVTPTLITDTGVVNRSVAELRWVRPALGLSGSQVGMPSTRSNGQVPVVLPCSLVRHVG
jgi:hypothetical protein